MVKDTLFIEKYKLRFSYSKLYSLAQEFGYDSVSDFASAVSNMTLGEKGLIRVLEAGLQTLQPAITKDDLIKEGGLFDKFFETHDSGYGGIVNEVLVQAFVDAGILTRNLPPSQQGTSEGN